MKKLISKAIFPIAGLGTRFLPATKSVPKEMLTILDKPVIEWAIEDPKSKDSGNDFYYVIQKKSSFGTF